VVDKEKLGEFLGSADEFNKKCLEIFTDSLSFKKMNIDEAMRYYLSLFMLPGEGQ
jgi:Sec7-like guanine-nucleotide exchange factor